MSVGSRGEGPDIVLLCGAQRIHDKQPASMIVIDVPDIDATVERLRRRGVSVGAIHKVPFGRAAMIEDPDGNVLEVHQPSKPLAVVSLVFAATIGAVLTGGFSGVAANFLLLLQLEKKH